MKIIALVENTTNNDDLRTVHGLAIYIETPKHKLMFDLGPDNTVFNNARELGIDLTEVDTVVISHGHFDHGGALEKFLETNSKAKIYLRRQAFEPYYARVVFIRKYIGLDADLALSERIVFTDAAIRIDDELFVFSDVKPTLDTNSSRKLLKKTRHGYERDVFDHEQNLVLTSEGKTALFSGCSHTGIAGIIAEAQTHRPGIDAVFGGFHLYNPSTGAAEPEKLVRDLADRLNAYGAVYYTCHCTGKKAFTIMRETIGDKLQYFASGTVIEL